MDSIDKKVERVEQLVRDTDEAIIRGILNKDNITDRNEYFINLYFRRAIYPTLISILSNEQTKMTIREAEKQIDKMSWDEKVNMMFQNRDKWRWRL